MVRNIVVLGGSSHPRLTNTICDHLGIAPAKRVLSKFSVGETRVEIEESVRGKDVFIIQSGGGCSQNGGGKVNDMLMEVLILISACKTASAKRVTVVLPLFPYSRQSDIPYNKQAADAVSRGQQSAGLSNGADVHKHLAKLQIDDKRHGGSAHSSPTKPSNLVDGFSKSNRSSTFESEKQAHFAGRERGTSTSLVNGHQDNPASATHVANPPHFEPQRGYKQWVAHPGTLVADLITCAGADHVITIDLHDPQYQGFFDIPVDNLYGRHLLRKYIQYSIPGYREAVIVSPDAGGAKRATAIADALGMPFALIHKERRPTQITERQNATMMLVGDVAHRTAILIDDLADTSNTITRAAKLLKKEGATKVYALVTHGVLSGDAIERINASALDKVVVTNSVDQTENERKCPKLEVLEIGHVFAEVSGSWEVSSHSVS
ncbi:ribose-phosphate pyrophosphokinase [Coniosporium tulheliwenetii]|uniref:Ribose-phosphate pyrophosphokinase n=1 Tax=Coniosporium tulheliwenetii TaxID=3383036 RepID=A0ACC2Z7B3_9PEZI|nr:ribose-phosphate pyrophosphokinase [Cladosporium sp. JES 115]